ncbi:hypothetical protein CLIB1423_02S08900 [[Candida] railenensis]|uniref:J domain-containing protein n=1 Tax=[Candida] railenensis TaxID=45579 RepID=A0A9P0QLN1_9ASCO|nr:hypothetical protein CLIB1423_02S08900 [[Candida] railenensis]
MSHYEILGIQPNATDEEVKKSYKRLAIKYHPDKSSDPQHHELFIKIQKAYETLKDPKSRNQYDLETIPAASSPRFPSTTRGATTTTTHHTTSSPGANSYYSYTTFSTTSSSYYDFYDRMNPNLNRRSNVRDYRTQPQPDEIERRRKQEEERIRLEQEERERQQLDRRLKREAQIRMMKELEKQRQEQRNASRPFESQNGYDQRKRDAYERAHGMKKGSSNDPIVLSEGESESDLEVTAESIQTEVKQEAHDREESAEEDEEDNDGEEQEEEFFEPGKRGEESFAFKSSSNQNKNGPSPSPSFNTDPYAERLFPNISLDDYFDLNSNMKLRERQQPPRYKSFMEKGSSPKRTPEYGRSTTEANFSNVRGNKDQRGSNKRTKLNNHWNLNDLSSTLDSTNAFETNPMDDLFESLPNDLRNDEEARQRTRKASSNLTHENTKKPRFEFTDGRARADTLHRPVNGTQYKAYAALQMSDLDADPAILDVYPPVNPRLNHISPELISHAMRKYLKDFFEYKKKILQYQSQRMEKDQQLSDTLLSSTSNFNVYSQCLLQDAVVSERYSKALIENSGVFRDFQELISANK